MRVAGLDWVGWISALAAAGAFAAAAWQLWGIRQDAIMRRAADIENVAVVTDVKVRPVSADAGGGRSKWVYDFSVHNPGSLPISHVEVVVTFVIPVEREHFDGSIDASRQDLDLNVPVIPGRGSKCWRRTVLVEHHRREDLRRTQAAVTFSTPDAGRVRTTWPQQEPHGRVDRRLQKRLQDRQI